MSRKIIGIAGAFGSGKSTAADFFESMGFKKIILSRFLEEEVVRRGLGNISRKILQDIGNEWREKYGSSVLAEKALEEISEKNLDNIVVDGIRNIGEIERLRSEDNFTLIAIISDKRIRFERLRRIKRRENMNWEMFEQIDNRDAGIGEAETGLQVNKCIEMADISIENNGSEQSFNDRLIDFLKNYGE